MTAERVPLIQPAVRSASPGYADGACGYLVCCHKKVIHDLSVQHMEDSILSLGEFTRPALFWELVRKTFGPTTRFWSVALGAATGVAVASAAQLWSYPYPRGLLLQFAFNCGMIAIVFGIFARSCETQPRTLSRLGLGGSCYLAAFFTILVGVLGLYGPNLINCLYHLTLCGNGENWAVCSATVDQITTIEQQTAMRNSIWSSTH
jgi:hypothetical protein